MVKVFILDLDGTLIDSHDAHVKSFTKILHIRNLYTKSKDLRKYFGLQEEEILKKLFPKISEKVLKDIIVEKRELFINDVKLVKKKRCANKVLKKLSSLGLVTLATSCHMSEVLAVLNQFNWSKYFSEIISSYEVPRPKPAPDILLEIIRLLSVSKEDCVFIGDTVYDAMTAQSAGIKFIGINKDLKVINEFKSLGIKNIHKSLCSIFSSLSKLP